MGACSSRGAIIVKIALPFGPFLSAGQGTFRRHRPASGVVESGATEGYSAPRKPKLHRFLCASAGAAKSESQYENEPMRIAANGGAEASREARRRKVTGRAGFPPRPLRMHWRTYRRLEALDPQRTYRGECLCRASSERSVGVRLHRQARSQRDRAKGG
jgi:hypothetical protein